MTSLTGTKCPRHGLSLAVRIASFLRLVLESTRPMDKVSFCEADSSQWLSGNTLASINIVALRQTRLVQGWVTVCGRVNHFGM